MARTREEVVITYLADRVVQGEASPKTGHQHRRTVEYELKGIGPERGLIIGAWAARG
ncbi:MAG: hypothetical protein QF541_23030 [Lentisphaeria bacterium]|jgi:hypothetical protein|nr:hypothetical protein [Lentisphaeria bacterium]